MVEHRIARPGGIPRNPLISRFGDVLSTHNLFSGKAQCNNCHVEPLWTDPGWNLHTPDEVCIDNFQANRAPDMRYLTAPIGDLFTHSKGGFYHDGRFSGPSITAALSSVVDHYNTCKSLNLSSSEKSDLVQYLLSLTFGPQGK